MKTNLSPETETMRRYAFRRTVLFAFMSLNRTFYSGKLPCPAFAFFIRLRNGNLAQVEYRAGQKPRITYSQEFYKEVSAMNDADGALYISAVTLHEMAHLACYHSPRKEYDDTNGHGQAFRIMCEQHGLSAKWCDGLQYADTELKEPELPVFREISDAYARELSFVPRGDKTP